MTVGDKIKKYRILQDMTQKDLGLKVGFSAATADSRIRKYEKDLMAPKEDLRRKIAEVLDVDISALSDIDIRSYEDIMQIFFHLEEDFGMNIERTEDKTYLVFDNKKTGHPALLSYLYAWYVQKKNITPGEDDAAYNAYTQYEKWKARFPRDLNTYLKEQEAAVDAVFSPEVKTLASKRDKIKMLSQFFLDVRNLIRTGATIDIGAKTFGVGDMGITMTFSVAEILDNKVEGRKQAFTAFLCDVEDMHGYGMPRYRELFSNESGTKISYILRWSALPMLKPAFSKLQLHESEKASLSDLEIDSFEKSLQYDIKNYDLNLKEEIGFASQKLDA